ncbi:MAG TPA: hypothetical protein VFS38_05810, partial [Actinomycetota bacterium]|nr:hypothetical protein [Actinomycetota bacterium]
MTPFRWGDAFFHERLPRVWDLNFLRVDGGAQDMDAGSLAEEADLLQGGAGLEHRMVSIEDDRTGERVAPALRSMGWSVECLVIMWHRRPAYREVDTTPVTEIDEDTAAAATAAFT